MYTMRYLSFPALPGNVPEFPLGWWGWFDQSKTLDSARALASGVFAPDRHWYPLGYSVLGALFAHAYRAHPFFLIDLVLLLIAYIGFVAFARRIGISAAWSVSLFLFTTTTDHRLFDQWVIPWNTTATAALIWLLLATVAGHMKGTRRPFVLGLLAVAIPLFRPTEAVLVVPSLIAVALVDIRLRWFGWTDAAKFLVGVSLLALPYAILYLRIYGPHPSEYMVQSHEIGFTLYDIGWKAYVILIDPRGWFMDGEGLLHRDPWIALSLAGVLPALVRRNGAALLAVLLVVHAVLYLAYIDLLPIGFWRYNNVHYWAWAMPGYGLLAVLLLQDLVLPSSRMRRAVAVGSTVASAIILCMHLEPRPATDTEPSKMVDLPGPPLAFTEAYYGHWSMQDNDGVLPNISAVRGIPTQAGMRVVALRRPFVGPVRWVQEIPGWQSGDANPLRWRVDLRMGSPCWLVRCYARTSSAQLPPVE